MVTTSLVEEAEEGSKGGEDCNVKSPLLPFVKAAFENTSKTLNQNSTSIVYLDLLMPMEYDPPNGTLCLDTESHLMRYSTMGSVTVQYQITWYSTFESHLHDREYRNALKLSSKKKQVVVKTQEAAVSQSAKLLDSDSLFIVFSYLSLKHYKPFLLVNKRWYNIATRLTMANSYWEQIVYSYVDKTILDKYATRVKEFKAIRCENSNYYDQFCYLVNLLPQVMPTEKLVGKRVAHKMYRLLQDRFVMLKVNAGKNIASTRLYTQSHYGVDNNTTTTPPRANVLQTHQGRYEEAEHNDTKDSKQKASAQPETVIGTFDANKCNSYKCALLMAMLSSNKYYPHYSDTVAVGYSNHLIHGDKNKKNAPFAKFLLPFVLSDMYATADYEKASPLYDNNLTVPLAYVNELSIKDETMPNNPNAMTSLAIAPLVVELTTTQTVPHAIPSVEKPKNEQFTPFVLIQRLVDEQIKHTKQENLDTTQSLLDGVARFSLLQKKKKEIMNEDEDYSSMSQRLHRGDYHAHAKQQQPAADAKKKHQNEAKAAASHIHAPDDKNLYPLVVDTFVRFKTVTIESLVGYGFAKNYFNAGGYWDDFERFHIAYCAELDVVVVHNTSDRLFIT